MLRNFTFSRHVALEAGCCILMAAFLTAVIGLSGCVSLAMRNLREDPMPAKMTKAVNPLDCVVYVNPIQDERPEYEKEGGWQGSTFFVFLLFGYWARHTGPAYVNPEYLSDETMLADLRGGLNETLALTGICRTTNNPKEADYIVIPRLIHLQGVHYVKSIGWALPRYSKMTDIIFFPVGFASMQFDVYRPGVTKPLTSFTLSTGSMFDPRKYQISLSSLKPGDPAIEDATSSEVVSAVAKLYKRFPRYLKWYLMPYLHKSGPLPVKQNGFFYISRFDKSYEWIERAKISYKTGRVIESKLVQRNLPVFAKAGKWYISPYQDRFLTPKEYGELTRYLATKFYVEWTDNLSSAEVKISKDAAGSMLMKLSSK